MNPAKSLALELADSVPVVLGDGDVTAVAACRAVSMLARTARVPAMRGALPDDAGDVVATFGGPLASRPDDLFADPFVDGGGPGPAAPAAAAGRRAHARTARTVPGWRRPGSPRPSGPRPRRPASG